MSDNPLADQYAANNGMAPDENGNYQYTNSNGVIPGSKSDYSFWNGNWKGYLQYLAEQGDSAAIDKLFSYMMAEDSATTARNWTAEREDHAVERFAADARRAGFNPIALMQMGGSPISSSSNGFSYGGSQFSSYDVNKEKNDLSALRIGVSFAAIFGYIIAAML